MSQEETRKLSSDVAEKAISVVDNIRAIHGEQRMSAALIGANVTAAGKCLAEAMAVMISAMPKDSELQKGSIQRLELSVNAFGRVVPLVRNDLVRILSHGKNLSDEQLTALSNDIASDVKSIVLQSIPQFQEHKNEAKPDSQGSGSSST